MVTYYKNGEEKHFQEGNDLPKKPAIVLQMAIKNLKDKGLKNDSFDRSKNFRLKNYWLSKNMIVYKIAVGDDKKIEFYQITTKNLLY